MLRDERMKLFKMLEEERKQAKHKVAYPSVGKRKPVKAIPRGNKE